MLQKQAHLPFYEWVLVIHPANEQLAPALLRSSAATRGHYTWKRGGKKTPESGAAAAALQQLQPGLHTRTRTGTSLWFFSRRIVMALKNTVAAERRLDLASLFCMIGRHGPAVALAVIAMVSVLAAFIIYRTVRGKRRKAAAGDGEMSSAEDERDASVIHPSPDEHHRSGESTGKEKTRRWALSGGPQVSGFTEEHQPVLIRFTAINMIVQ